MSQFPNSIQKLIDLFSKFPTVGPRTASRFVFYLIKLPKNKFDELIDSMKKLKDSIIICFFCFNPFDSSSKTELPPSNFLEEKLCRICRNHSRDKTTICLVEKEGDLITIENTKKYRGLYFILGDLIPTFKKDNEERIRIEELIERIKRPSDFGIVDTDFKEIIIALNPTTEGEATALYIERKLKSALGEKKLKITRLGRGLPVGGELEYADEETLGSAFEGRK